MQRLRKAMLLALMTASTAVFAQADTGYSLNGDKVHFSVPADWVAIMQKHDGNPQAVIFQVPDPSAEANSGTASVTVKTRTLTNPAQFAAAVQSEFDLSKQQTGYARDAAHSDGSAHQYFVQRGKTRYLVRDSFFLTGTVAVQVRCQRPLIASTPQGWIAGFDAACARVFASLKQPGK
ncbi:MAG TPA: hypothetical protein VFG55_04150 [Rhodanobacteraceae bacterium]|nr:hypothetical protein [Rhodanobacteraceae bacterium]